MKKLLFFLCLLISTSAICQVTAIPDENFEEALIDQGIDSDDTINGQVLTSDIEKVVELDVSYWGIEDLTGLENFTALEILDVTANYLTTLDVSNNVELKELYCGEDSVGFTMNFFFFGL
ncbi:hypothetical protein [uncultured Marixanthomonas sp.]|uniref:hypothetical protein n=1 Tax=uncultured Marixanthomonas sp. TaxID=757245 RepID=UPI0030D76846|tara:strand:- start:124660 stop:125019 length:360 start_codon:yes stop_codon:yes gene_type:complete